MNIQYEYQKKAMEFLPVELVCEIVRHLDSKSMYNFMCTCAQFNKVVSENMLFILGLGTSTRNLAHKHCYKEQILALSVLKKYNATWNFVEAPMGSGKTAVMITLCKNNPGRNLILINTKVYTSWVVEFKKFGHKLNQDPTKSDFLMVHSKYPKHRDLALGSNKIPDRIKIVVTTSYYLFKHKKSRGLKEWINNPLSQIIVDEAHLMHILYTRCLGSIGYGNVKHFWFSGSPMRQLQYIQNPYYYHKISLFSRGYPKLDIERHSTNRPLEFNIPNLINNSDYKHIVVFSGRSVSSLRVLAKTLKGQVTKCCFYVFSNTAPSWLEKWKKASKSVILCNYRTAAEGINLSEADCAIFSRFDCISIETARQSLGRIRRKNSVHGNIKVLFLGGDDDVGHIRSVVNQAYAQNLKMGSFRKKTCEQMRVIQGFLKRDGYNVKNMSTEDILRIFTTQHSSLPSVDLGKLTLPVEKVIMYSQI